MEFWCIEMLIYLCWFDEKLFLCDEGGDTSSVWRWEWWGYVVSLMWSLVPIVNAWWKHTWIWLRSVKLYVISCYFTFDSFRVQHAWMRKWSVCMTDLNFNLVVHVYRKEKKIKLLCFVGVGRISHEHGSMEMESWILKPWPNWCWMLIECFIHQKWMNNELDGILNYVHICLTWVGQETI